MVRLQPMDHALNLRCHLAAGVFALCLVSCGFVHDEHLVGPYRLVAVDSLDDMGICYDLGSGNCLGRITETVFAAGWDTLFIVAKRHPRAVRQ